MICLADTDRETKAGVLPILTEGRAVGIKRCDNEAAAGKLGGGAGKEATVHEDRRQESL